MVDNCKHILRLSPASDHSILNPQKWACGTCGTTESVWACLGCSNVGCGRYIDEHAVRHYEETKHPLALEVNEKYVYCYECDDYVLNDNAAGDVKILRNALKAITTLSFNGINKRSQRMLRSQSVSCFETGHMRKNREEDLAYTALWFRRYYTLAKAFSGWKQIAGVYKKPEPEPVEVPATRTPTRDKDSGKTVKKKTMVPGVTGLRNLGNTCYMNSVLQVLRYLLSYSHLDEFREFFLSLKEGSDPSSPVGSSKSPANLNKSLPISMPRNLKRQTTMECFQYVNSDTKKGGLNGGSSTTMATALKKLAQTKGSPSNILDNISLCEELHALLRVMWSGKWALVSPHKMLYAVWNIIPFFKGYSQQDAQEFLCEFLDKVSGEYPLNMSSSLLPTAPTVSSRQSPPNLPDIVTKMFQGQLVSEVTCLRCNSKSHTYEPFMDLSLEFPNKFQNKDSQESCRVDEMLSKFTETEILDGQIYACSKCNSKYEGKRRKAAMRPTTYTEASKKFMISKLPHVLRLHLKRFMWGGRNNRGKITTHVDMRHQLDVKPYSHSTLEADNYVYLLSAVVMHHGRGFGSGHYTAYCWNTEANHWVHCNDAKMTLCTLDDVMKAQGYILFYTRKNVPVPFSDLAVPLNNSSFEETADEDIIFNFKNSTIPRFVELKRKLSDNHWGRKELKRRKSSMW